MTVPDVIKHYKAIMDNDPSTSLDRDEQLWVLKKSVGFIDILSRWTGHLDECCWTEENKKCNCIYQLIEAVMQEEEDG
jgi:hypothetical protein